MSHGLLAVGKFDGVHSSLAYATAGGKVCIQSPHAFGELPRVQYLNINREVTALAAGVLDTALGRDLLLIGTNSSLQAYDVYANQDLFFKDVSDGVSTLAAGQLGWQTAPAIVVGGVCSLFACDSLGNENYWTVTGGTVSALAFCTVNDRGQRGLLLGCSDYTIKMLQDETVVVEIAEADRIIGLSSLYGTKFAYALANGTIGVYDLGTRCWRVKSKHSVTAICSHVVDGSKQPDLVTAWSNGRVSIRHILLAVLGNPETKFCFVIIVSVRGGMAVCNHIIMHYEQMCWSSETTLLWFVNDMSLKGRMAVLFTQPSASKALSMMHNCDSFTRFYSLQQDLLYTGLGLSASTLQAQLPQGICQCRWRSGRPTMVRSCSRTT